MDWMTAAKRTVRHNEFLNAVSQSNFEEMNRLIGEGVDVNFQDENGDTAMIVAIEHADPTVIKFLVDKGAKLDVENNNRETLLNVAERVNRPDILEMVRHLHSPALNDKLVPIHESKKVENKIQTIESAGSTNPVHGHIYQLKVLMLFLHRGVACKYSFRLGTEVKEARKFDDLVFEYTQGNQKVYRLLQAKHRLDESKKITVDKLLSESNGDYSLLKYFKSYQDCKGEPFFENGIIEDVIICTNINFDFHDLKKNKIEVRVVKEKDDILDIKSNEKLPMRYQFTNSLVPKLKHQLLQSSKFRSECIVSDDEIHDFLQHLVFAVNQPNEEELGDIVKNEISREFFDCITTENAYNAFFMRMLNWMKGSPRKVFWSHVEGKILFEEIKKGMFVWYNIQDPVKSFTGRRKYLDDIHKLLQTGNQTMVCVSGLGGVGKSELVKKYVAEYNQSYDNNVIWINAECYQTLVDSFRKLACDKLRVKTKNADDEEKHISVLVAETYQCFFNKKSLFVFENSEMYRSQNELDAGIDRFLPCLPSSCEKPYVIITSRNQNWPENVNVLLLGGFADKEAESFINESLRSDHEEQKEHVVELGQKLQLLPLALQQAIAYINAQNDKLRNVGSCFRIIDYFEKLSEKTREILNFKFPSDCDNMYTQTVFTTWNVTLDAIKKKEDGDEALAVLNVLSYLHSDNIPLEVLCIFITEKENLPSAIELLKQYSLLSIEYKVINLHRLVKQVTRIKLTENNLEKQTLETLLKQTQKDTINFKNVDHFLSIWTYSKTYIELVEKYHSVSTMIMNTLISSSRTDEVHLMGNELIQQLQQLPPDNENTSDGLIEAKICIAIAFSQQGKYEIALKNFQELRRNRVIVNLEYNTAVTLQKLGKHDEALEILQETLKIVRAVVGENNYVTLEIKSGIAGALMETGKYADVKLILKEILNDAEKNMFDQEYYASNIRTVKSSLGGILTEEGKYEEALEILQDVYNTEKTILPENNLEVIATRLNIAEVYKRQEKYDLSFKTNEDIYKTSSPILGENHPYMLMTQISMALILHESGRSDEALKTLQEVFVKQRNTLGFRNPTVLETHYFIANIFKQQGKYSEALTNFQELLRHDIQILDNDHPMPAAVRHHIFAILIMQNKFYKALEFGSEAWNMCKNRYGLTHRSTLIFRENVVILYMYIYNYDKAMIILTELQRYQEPVVEKKKISYFFTPHAIRKILFEQNQNQFANVAQTSNDPFEAVQSSNFVLLKKLVTDGADVNAQDRNGMTLLHHATNEDELKIVGFLLENGSDIARMSTEGNTVLHIAASKNYIETAEVLLQAVSNDELRKFVDAVTRTSGTTALHIASANGFYEMTRLILSRGATYDVRNKEGERPIDVAKDEVISRLLNKVDVNFQQASAGKEELHRSLKESPIDEYLAYINARNRDGHDIVQVAIINNHQNLISLLQSLKVEVFRSTECTPKFNTNFDELLTLAATALNKLQDENCTQKESLKYVRKFVSTFRSLEKRTSDQNILAIEDVLRLLECHQNTQTFVELAKQVIETHVKLFSASIYSVKLLESTRCKDWTLAEKCITGLAHVNLSDEGGWTPLLLAVNAGNKKIAKMLLEHGARANCSTKTDRKTPLHIAASKGDLGIVRLLLRRDKTGEFVNAKTEAKGSTALHLAAEVGRLDIAIPLLQSRAVYCSKNKDGKMPVDLTSNESIKSFFKLIDELFDDAKKGTVGMIDKLKALDSEEFLAVASCCNEENNLLTDISAMNGHVKLSSSIYFMLEELLCPDD